MNKNIKDMSYREKMTWYSQNQKQIIDFEPKSLWSFKKNTDFDRSIQDKAADETAFEDALIKELDPNYHHSWGARGTFSKFNSEYARKIIQFYSCIGDKILDLFAGRTRQLICEKLKRNYVGFEINPKFAPKGVIVDDCANINEYFDQPIFDLLFTCPPYWNLEKYSQLPGDLSACATYEQFLAMYKRRLEKGLGLIKKDGLAVIVVADFRKKGIINSLHIDTINIIKNIGWNLYDTIILEMSPAARHCYYAQAITKRRMLTTHEYCLIFCKENPSIEIRKQIEDYNQLNTNDKS